MGNGKAQPMNGFLTMSNTFATTGVVAKESLAIPENMLTFAKGVNRSWESEFSSNMARGYAPGQTINIKSLRATTGAPVVFPSRNRRCKRRCPLLCLRAVRI